MKKILFATTALVMTAGVASAEVAFSGYGRFGLAYNDTPAPGVSETNITSRFRLTIDATAESDAGVEFGARVRIQQTNGGAGTGINGARFFARAGGLEVGVGNTIGAFEGMSGQYPIDLGLTGLGYEYTAYAFGADAYSSAGAGASTTNGIELIYTAGDFKVHVSASNGAGDRVAGVVEYTFSGWTGALGYQDSSVATDTEWTATIGGDLGPVAVTLGYGQLYNGTERWVLAGGYDVSDDLNIQAYYTDDSSFADDNSYGIDFNYSLGGGTSFRGGVAKRGAGNTVADLGVRFDF